MRDVVCYTKNIGRERERERWMYGFRAYNFRAVSNLRAPRSADLKGTLVLEARDSRCRIFRVGFRLCAALRDFAGYIPPLANGRRAAPAHISHGGAQ